MTSLQRWLIVGLIAACGIVSGAHGGRAQGVVMITPLQCNLTEDMVKQLGLTYKEVAIGAGISSKGYQVRLFVSKDNTFTVLETRPGGISCINSAGGDWTMKPIGDDT